MDESADDWSPEELLLAATWDSIDEQDVTVRVRLPFAIADGIVESARVRRARRVGGVELEPAGPPGVIGLLALRIEAVGLREPDGVVVDLDPFMLGMVFLAAADPDDANEPEP